MTAARVLELTRFVSVADVVQVLRCPRSTAYEHMNRAWPRAPGSRGLRRIPMIAWEDYLRGVSGLEALRGRACSPVAPTCRGVYFLQHDRRGPIKIGHAGNVALRVRLLQAGNPYPLYLLGVIRDEGREQEKRLHAEFAPSRLGGEWFFPSDALLAYIASLK